MKGVGNKMTRTNSKEWQKRRDGEEHQRDKLNVLRTLSISGNKKDVFAILKNLKDRYGQITIKEILDDWNTDKLQFC